MNPKLASEPQRKLYFALASELGANGDAAKERAKKVIPGLISFADITSSDISELIRLMKEKIDKIKAQQKEQAPTEEPLCTDGKHKFVCKNCRAALELVVIPHTH